MTRSSNSHVFSIQGRVAVITGGAGLLGRKHAEAVLEIGGTPVLLDVSTEALESAREALSKSHGAAVHTLRCDITSAESVKSTVNEILDAHGRIDILINNAANNPKVEAGSTAWTRFENFPLDLWNQDLQVGVTGAFLCSQAIGSHMSQRGSGVIVNILSDLACVAPDQRLYQVDGLPSNQQPVKPVTYSVAKTALLGLTRYLSTYWAHCGVRAVSLSPGGVENGQPDEFIQRISNLIPMGRMAKPDEYKGAIQFLISDASSYMNGANLVIDGGRSAW